MAGWKSIKWACGLMQFSKIKDCCVLIQSANIYVLPDENPFFFQQWIHFRLDLNPSFYSQWIQYKYFNSVLAYFQLAYSSLKTLIKFGVQSMPGWIFPLFNNSESSQDILTVWFNWSNSCYLIAWEISVEVFYVYYFIWCSSRMVLRSPILL